MPLHSPLKGLIQKASFESLKYVCHTERFYLNRIDDCGGNHWHFGVAAGIGGVFAAVEHGPGSHGSRRRLGEKRPSMEAACC